MSHHPSPLALQYSKAIGAFNGSDVWSAWCFVKKFLMLAPLRRLRSSDAHTHRGVNGRLFVIRPPRRPGDTGRCPPTTLGSLGNSNSGLCGDGAPGRWLRCAAPVFGRALREAVRHCSVARRGGLQEAHVRHSRGHSIQ